MATSPKTSFCICTLAITAMIGLQSFLVNQPDKGEALFEKHCTKCHGTDGTLGLFGAKNLKTSTLTDEGIIRQIQNGKGFMPSFRKKLSTGEITQLVVYVKTLRKN